MYLRVISMKPFFCCFTSQRKRNTTFFVSALMLCSLFLLSSRENLDVETEIVYIQPEEPDSRFDGISTGDMSWLENPEDFFFRLEQEKPRTRCRKLVRFGGQSCQRTMDGDKAVCLDPDVALRPPNCTTFSFGISTDPTFDVAMSRFGCNVYMMDPTLPPTAYQELLRNQKFFSVGLDVNSSVFLMDLGFDSFKDMKMVNLEPFSRVREIVNYEGPVHYLKLDIENTEWRVFKDMMEKDELKDTKQIAVEIHLLDLQKSVPPDKQLEFVKNRWQILDQLEEYGFERAQYNPTFTKNSKYIFPKTNVTVFVCGELLLLNRNLPEIF